MTSLLMQSLPNSGSTWLADLIAKHSAWSDYHLEFFNPLRNPKYYGILSRSFGCELAACYRHIAEAGDERIDEDIRDSWQSEGANFTKEVFSPYKLEAFARHFRCFVLLRDEADTFPPTRARVWSFYEHAWFALRDAGRITDDPAAPPVHFEARALAAHRVMSAAIAFDAERLDVPMIRYRELFVDEGLPELIAGAIGECSPALLKAIKAGRRLTER